MDSTQLVVTLTGLFLSGFIIWFFLLSGRKNSRALADAAGVQEITIQVKGGYDPERIVVRKGTPVRLNFFRNETSGCSERVLFEAFGINLELPAFQTTSVTLVPDKPGEYPFTCGMNMLRGTLVVEE